MPQDPGKLVLRCWKGDEREQVLQVLLLRACFLFLHSLDAVVLQRLQERRLYGLLAVMETQLQSGMVVAGSKTPQRLSSLVSEAGRMAQQVQAVLSMELLR